MRLRGYPPNGEVALSFVGQPDGAFLGSNDPLIGYIRNLQGFTDPSGPISIQSFLASRVGHTRVL